MTAKITSKPRVSATSRQPRAARASRPLRYKHLAFGVGLALGSLLVCGMATAAGPVANNQTPTGGKVVGGAGSITQSGASTVINQQSKMLALDWQTFNVGKDASVLFNQPGFNAVALNRILDQNPSQIFGKVTSNGQIFLINTHGIIFGASAQLNVGGLVASTLDLTPQDFLKEHFSLDAHGGNAGIVNHGTIAAASGGSVSLVGGHVENTGLIVADYGHINLDGANTAVLDFDGNGLISVKITGALQQRFDADQAAVSNSGTLQAKSGTVVLQASAAKNLFTDMVNNSGVIKAGGISTAGGVVRLVGSGGNVVSSGSIDASGSTGGSVQLLSDENVGVMGGSINASGTYGGGSIRVGGGWKGGEGLPTAQVSYVAPDATLNADAVQSGNGGSVVVWGLNGNNFYGSISARGGAQGGNGGQVETSSHHGLNAQGTVDVAAPFGAAGLWLLDPYNVTIQTGGAAFTNPFTASATSTVDPTNINSALTGGANVIVFTNNTNSGNGTDNGDIFVKSPIAAAGAGNLYLEAAGSIFVDADISAAAANPLNVHLWANYGKNNAGTSYSQNASCGSSTGCQVAIADTASAAITTHGGDLDVRTDGAFNVGNTGTATTASIDTGAGDLNIGATGGFTINSQGTLTLAGSGTVTLPASIVANGQLGFALGSDYTYGGVISGTGSLSQSGANTLTLTGVNIYSGATTVGSGATLALDTGGSIADSSGVAADGTFDISQATAGATIQGLSGAGTVALGSKTLTISSGSTPWNFSGVLADGGIGGGTGGSFVMDEAGVTGVLGGTNTYTGDTTIKGGTLSVSSDGNLGTGNLILDGGTLENTASFTLNRAVSITSNGGTLQNDAATNLTVANAITGNGDLVQNGPGTLTLDANVTTTGANQTYNGILALGSAVTLTANTVNLGTVTGNGNDLTVAGDAVLNGVATVPNLNVTGSGNELDFGTAGSVSGNVNAAILDYGNYLAAVTFDTANGTGTTTGIGGTWTAVGTVIGNGTDSSATGIGAGTFTLSGTQAGSAGTIDFSGFTAADAQNVAGAVGFDDTAKSSEGITFANATNVAGNGTVSNVAGDFDDGTGQSLASTIFYTGFSTVVGTGTGSVTDVTADFDDGTGKSSATGIAYTGFGTVAGTSGGSVTGVAGDFDDGTRQSSATSIIYTGFGAVAGTSAGNVTGVTGNFDDGTGQSSASAILYTGFGTVVGTSTASVTDVTGDFNDGTGQSSATGTAYTGFGTVVGAGGSVTNVTGAFNDGTGQSAATSIIYAGFGAVAGSGGVVTNIAGDFDVDSDASSASGIDYSGFNLASIAGSGVAGTLTGTNHTYTLSGGDAGTVAGGPSWTGFGNIDDASGTVNFGTSGTLSGNVTADTLDYGTYAGSVTVNLSGAGTTGVGGTVTGIADITSQNSLAVTGASAGNLDLTTTGAGATTTIGGLTVNGNLAVDSGGAVQQGGAGPLTVTGTTGINAHANAITLDDAGNHLAGVVTVSNSGANAVTIANGTHALQLGNVHVGSGALALSGTGITQATGTTITQAAGALAATFNAGAGALTLTNAGNDLTGQVGLSNSGAFDVALDNGANALSLGNVNVGTGALTISAKGISQVPGTGIVQAPGAGAASFNANAGVLNLNSTLNDLTGIVNLANSGNNLVYLDNGGNALTLGTLNVGSGALTLTDYGVTPLLLTNDVTTSGGAVTFGGAVTIGSPAVTIDTTGSGAGGANISFGGDVNGATANADSLTLTAGSGAVNFGGAVGNTAALDDLTTTSKTFSAAGTLGINGDLSITTTGGPISQGGAWSVGGNSNFNAGSNAITLTNGSNSFGGPITATGGAVELAGTGTLDMGAVTATSLKLDGASLLHDDITTTGTQTYNGAVTLDGSGNSVALHGNGIAFASTVDNLSSANPQDLTVDAGTGAAQFNGAVGNVNGPLGALVVNGTGQAQFLGNVAAASLTATAPVLLGANVTTSGNQTYNGAVALGTNVVASSSNGDVSFASTVDNAVAGTPESLTVTAANGAVKFGNAVGTLNGQLGNLTSSSATFSATGALAIGGDLAVATTGGAIGQSAAWQVAGNSVFNAGNAAVTLTNPNNDFTGTVTVTGAGVSVRDVNDLTIGGLTDNNNGNVSLVAGGQLFGVGPINAGTGSITLTAAGAVLTTAALSGGNVNLTGGNGISLGDDVNASGTLTLTSGGTITQAPAAVITAGTLTGTATGATTLDGNNVITTLGNFTANGFSLTNSQALTVGSGIAIDGGAGGTALTTTSGDLTINGTVGNAAGTTALTSAGAINEGAGGAVIGSSLTGASAGDTNLTSSNNKIASVGAFNAVNFTLIDNAALSVAGPLVTTGDISLTTIGGPANVLNVGQALTGGAVTLNSAGDLSITQTVQGSSVSLTANGNLAVDAAVNSGAGTTTLTQNGAGSISEGAAGSITAGTLTGTAQGSADLDGANAVVNLGDFTAVGFSLVNAADLTVAAGSTVDGGASTSLTTTGAGSDLTIDGMVNGTTTTLVSGGAINEGAAAVVTADTLTGSSVGATSLVGDNAIDKLGNFTAAGLALTDGQTLTVTAGSTVDGGSNTTLTTTGGTSDLELDGTLKGTTTTLNVGGAIREGSAGSLVAGTLTGSSGGTTDLSGNNNLVSGLGNFTAVGFVLASNSGLTVASGATVDGGASTTLTTLGAGHDLGINGTVQGDLITLNSAGAIGEGAGGLVKGGDLTGSSVGDTNLTQTQIDQLDAFTAANFTLSNAGALSVAGPVATTGNAGDISLTTTGAGNALTVNQAVQGAAITLASAGDLTVANAVTGTQVNLAANGNLAIDAAVDSGAGTTTLTQTGSGAITGGTNGSITAATLTGSATGTTTLGSAGQFMANHVDTLGGFSSPAGFSFTNDGTLTLASVNGSAYTVDAGMSNLYLAVQNGDLLQIGNNWLYDGSGTWSSTGHIGSQMAPIYVTGASAQTIALIGDPPAYFYAIDYGGNLLPLTGGNAVNVPTSILSSKSQGVNGHSDQYIDISVVTAIYRGYGIVPTGLLLPPDQSACSPDQPPSDLCPDN